MFLSILFSPRKHSRAALRERGAAGGLDGDAAELLLGLSGRRVLLIVSLISSIIIVLLLLSVVVVVVVEVAALLLLNCYYC